MSYLKIFLLGPPYVVRDGQPVKIERRKASALLAYLAYTGASHTRDALATLFWPASNQAQARTALRKALLVLKGTLGEEWLEIERESLALKQHGCFELDVDRFHRLLAACQQHDHSPKKVCSACLVPLTEAVSLYRDDFMAGFSLRDSVAFDDWQAAQSESLRRALGDALERLVRGHSARGEFELAIDHARRWLARDPLHEPAHYYLMQLYLQVGQRADALRQYKACVQVLERELGTFPQEETVRLYDAIQENGDVQLAGLVLESLLARPPHNLPLQPTPFIGREQEMAEIDRLLQDPACRLLTLVGAGGSGKTRLALQAAREKIAAFQHGVYFVPLAPLSSADFLATAIAKALQFPLRGATQPQVQLLNYLRDKKVLLLLDNLEHLLGGEGVTLLVEILRNAPGAKLLVTSRERLNLQWEWPLEIQGLRYPQSGEIAALDALEEYSAVKMFLQGARKVCPRFSPSEEERSFIVRFCRFLEGLPLGIELAASLVETHSCRRIAEEIEHNLDLLVTSLQDVPKRHHSLRATFEYSWNLLSEEERNVFIKLSVFRGGFQREAAEKVADASPLVLQALVHKSFLRRAFGERYEMLEVLRQYAEEKLGLMPLDRDEARDRHCEYYARFLHQRQEHLKARGQKEALEEIGEEIANVRVGWQWAIERGKMATIGKAMESLYCFYKMWSWFQEGEEVFRKAADGLMSKDDATGELDKDVILGKVLARQGSFCRELSRYGRAKELLQQGLSAFRRLGLQQEVAFSLSRLGDVFRSVGEYAEAKRFLEEGLVIFEAIGEPHGVAGCLQRLSNVAVELGEYAEAQKLYRGSLAICQEIGDQQGIAHSFNSLGTVARMLGEFEEAKLLYQQSFAAFKEIGDRQGTAMCFNNLGIVARMLGEPEKAKRLHQGSLTIRQEIGDRWGVATCLNNLGNVASMQEEYPEAERLYQESLAIKREIGHKGGVAGCLANLGSVLCATGAYQQAREHFCKALEIAVEVKVVPLALEVLAGMAKVLTVEGQKEEAMELTAFVLQHPSTQVEARAMAKQLYSDLESRLAPRVFATAQKRGVTKTLEHFTRTYKIGAADKVGDDG